jgi:hypothetical protein
LDRYACFAIDIADANSGIENQMQSQEAEFCALSDIKALVMTWNAGATTPYHLQQKDEDKSFFPGLLRGSDSPDILVFGFQELVDLENKKTTASMYSAEQKYNGGMLTSLQKASSNPRKRILLQSKNT